MSDPTDRQTTLTADRLVALMRDHYPPREVYRGYRGGYWMTYPDPERPRLRVPFGAIHEALMRGMIREKYAGQQYWELAA